MRESLRPLALVALAALLPLLSTGCASRPWPKVRAAATPDFAQGAVPIASIDVLPIDVDLAARSDFALQGDALARTFDGAAGAAVINGLARAGYGANPIEWSGVVTMPDGSRHAALLAEEVAPTQQAFASYAALLDDPRVLGPALPVRLGAATGADATLYIGGEGYVGRAPTSKAAKVGKVVLIGLAIVALVAIAVVIARKGGGGEVVGKLAEGVGRAAVQLAKAGAQGVNVAARGAGRVTELAGRVAVRTLDAVARSNVDLNVHVQVEVPLEHGAVRPAGAAPPPAARPLVPAPRLERKGRSKTWLTMVLVDNRTGRVLWHAREHVGVSPADHGGVSKLVDKMLQTMPPRTAGYQ